MILLTSKERSPPSEGFSISKKQICHINFMRYTFLIYVAIIVLLKRNNMKKGLNMELSVLASFAQAQKDELAKTGWFKTYTKCKDCGTKFIFKNNDIKTKKVCICQGNNWIIERIIEC